MKGFEAWCSGKYAQYLGTSKRSCPGILFLVEVLAFLTLSIVVEKGSIWSDF